MNRWISLLIVSILLGSSALLLAAASATQATQPARLIELKKQRLALARKAASLADQLHASGLVSSASTLTAQRRVLAAERDLLEPAQRLESYRRELQMLEENEKLCRKRIAAGMGGQADLPAIEYAQAQTEILLAAATATRPSASAPAPLARRRVEIAQQGYELALAAWRAGEGPFHCALLWSHRLLEAQLALAASDAERRRVLRDYLEQARLAEETAAGRHKAGLASELEDRLGKADRLEAESLLARADGKLDETTRLLAECVQNLKLAAELCEELYGKGFSGIDEVAFVESWCFDAQAALLRAEGRMAAIPELRREQVQKLEAREDLIRSRAKAGLATEPDLLVAQSDVLEAEIALRESPQSQQAPRGGPGA